MNILNVTIREVRPDNISKLPYARIDTFGLVCLFSQQQSTEDEEKMQQFTQKVIDEVLKLNGTFYLPYRLHYNKHQLLKAYPNILNWLQLKKKWDPHSLFNSQFYEFIYEIH
jgi:FAD/FMN-containing dehydrogenase